MSTRRHWVEDDYEYSRPVRYANTSSNVYVTPQRYVTSYTESYSPVVRERSSRFPLFVTPARYEGKTLVRSIPSVAHQRLTTASYPPRSYVPHYEEERVLGYRVPPSSHAITTSSYRPWLEEEPMVEYMPYQPPRQIDYRPSYADTWKSTISPSTRARWNTGIEDDEDYYVDEEIDPNVYMPKTRRPRQQPPVKMVEPATTDYPGYFEEKYNDMLSTDRRVAKRAPGAMVPYRAPAISAPHYSYADKYQNDLEETLETSGVVPGNYFAARHTEPVPSIMLRRPIPKPRGPYDDLADEYPAHGRKYVVVPMRNVYNNIYNMSYYRKPMQQANIGSKKPVARVSYFGRDGELRSAKRELRSIQLESDKIEDKETKKDAKAEGTKGQTDEKKDETKDASKHTDEDKSQGSEEKKDAPKEKKKKKHKKVDPDLTDLTDEEAIMKMVEAEMEKEAKKNKKKAAAAAAAATAEEAGKEGAEGVKEGGETKTEGADKEAPKETVPEIPTAEVKPQTTVEVLEPEVTKKTIVIEASDDASAEEEINKLISETKRRISSALIDAGKTLGDDSIQITQVVKVKSEPESVVITEVDDAEAKPSTEEPTVTEPKEAA